MKISVVLLVGLCRASAASPLGLGTAHTQPLEQAQGPAPMLVLTVQDCQTEDDILAWETHKTQEIQTFVPKDYQEASLAEMRNEIGIRRREIATTAMSALPIFHASAGNFNSEADLSSWYNQEAAKIQESVPAESKLLAMQSLDREVESLRSSNDGADHTLPSFLFLKSPKNCTTLEELVAWKAQTEKQVDDTVPEDLRPKALRAVNAEFSKHESRFVEAIGTEAAPLPIFHASAGNFNSETDLSSWYNQEAAKIQESVPAESKFLAMQSLDREVESLRSSQDGADHTLPSVLFLKSPKNCTTLEELVAWKAQMEKQIDETVPEDLRPTALRAVDAEFSKRDSVFVEAIATEAAPEAVTTVTFAEFDDAAPVPASDQQVAMITVGAVSCLLAITFVASALMRRRSQAPEEEAVYMLQA